MSGWGRAVAVGVAILGGPTPARAAPPGCDTPVFADGAAGREICAAAAAAAGLTVLDLSATWTPTALAADADGAAPAYRATYLALAAGRYADADAGDDGRLAIDDRFLEVYGIVPSLAVIHGWLGDQPRHACHAAVDDTALAALTARVREEPAAAAAARVAAARRARAALAHEVRRLGLADLDALAARDAYHRRQVARLRAAETYLAAVAATQAHLVCDGLLAATPDARFGWRTADALAAFQRREALVPRGVLDADTREALRRPSPERDFRAALRALRERVVTATGLIEDGSAGAGAAPVLGRLLDRAAIGEVRGHVPLPDAAPDRIAAATEAAARALGWTTPAAVERSLAELLARDVRAVAVRLPPPVFVGDLELIVEVDRGDVWLDPAPRDRPVTRRPALVLYAVGATGRVPLVRWPTTIGGWQREGRTGDARRWKESPAGPRVWRELYVGPTWLPPATTPDDELIHARGGGRYALARELFGPSYRSAYGLAMFVHERVGRRRGGVTYDDQGVRTHGSGNIGSIEDGVSHGCHRLLPLHAVRLAGFVLQHRRHVGRGEAPTWYRRVVRAHGRFPVTITTRGYLRELTPPIAVEVLPGRIHPAP